MVSLEKKMSSGGPMGSPEAKRYAAECEQMFRNDPDSVTGSLPDARRMGFEQIALDFRTEAFKKKYQDKQREVLRNPKYKLERFAGLKKSLSMASFMPKMMRGMENQFLELAQNKEIATECAEDTVKLWPDMTAMMGEKWDIHHIGFTQVPRELIFKDKFILYRNALVLVQEMKKEEIAKAPRIPATREVFRVYATLGQAANDLARWLRRKGVRSQPVHPLGGLVLTPPLAGKAGLGWLGQSGNLITPAYGKRQRITVVLIDKPVFPYTDSTEHSWIKQYCESCGACVKACPTGAVLEKKQPYGEGIPVLGCLYRCIDYLSCFSYFEPSGGCSICLKTCPFSAGGDAYTRIKKNHEKGKTRLSKAVEGG